jgi:hypothetical protein
MKHARPTEGPETQMLSTPADATYVSRFHDMFVFGTLICFTICLCIGPDLRVQGTVCFTVCFFISPDLDGNRAPEGINPTKTQKVSKPKWAHDMFGQRAPKMFHDMFVH